MTATLVVPDSKILECYNLGNEILIPLASYLDLE